MRETLLRALRSHAQGEIEMHKANVEVYLSSPVGIGEHSGITQAIQEELDHIAKWEDQLEVIKKHFKLYRSTRDLDSLDNVLDKGGETT